MTDFSPSERILGRLSFAIMFVVGTDTFLTAPLLPLLRRELSIPVDAAGLLVSAYAIGYAVTALVAGPISDRTDRRRVLLGGMIAFTLFTAACGLAWDFPSLVMARLLAGVGAAFATPQVWASIPALVPPHRVVPTMGRATAGLAVAQLLGIPLGSFLSAHGWRIPFFAVGSASLVLTAVLVARFPSVSPARYGVTRIGYRVLLRRRGLTLSLVGYLAFQSGNFAALSFLGQWWSRDFAASQTTIGWAMLVVGAGNAVGSLAGARVTTRLGTGALGVGIVAMGGCYALTLGAHDFVFAVGPVTAAMFVAGALFPVLMNQLQRQAPEARGTVSALANAAMYLGTTVAGAAGGVALSATDGYGGIVAVTLIAFAVSLVLYGMARRYGG